MRLGEFQENKLLNSQALGFDNEVLNRNLNLALNPSDSDKDYDYD